MMIAKEKSTTLNLILKRNIMKSTKLLLLFIPFVFLSLRSFSQKNKVQKSTANGSWLRVSGDKIVDQKGETSPLAWLWTGRHAAYGKFH